jgi:hypothetical protein
MRTVDLSSTAISEGASVSGEMTPTPRSSGEPTAGRAPWRVYHPFRAAGCCLPLSSNVSDPAGRAGLRAEETWGSSGVPLGARHT